VYYLDVAVLKDGYVVVGDKYDQEAYNQMRFVSQAAIFQAERGISIIKECLL
jgi:flagellar basal body rod protein FlgF